MRNILASLCVVASAVLISSCCSGICTDVGANYTLTEVAYDQGGALLYVSGNTSLGYCEDCWEEVDKYAASQLVLDLKSLEYDVKIETTKDRKTIEAPVLVPRVFRGSFGSDCRLCDLSLQTEDKVYALQFTTDLEGARERIQGHGITGAAMLLTVFKGEDILAEFVFGYMSVDNLPS